MTSRWDGGSKSFSKVNEVLSMPDLIEVQKNSYYRFLKEDLREVFRSEEHTSELQSRE